MPRRSTPSCSAFCIGFAMGILQTPTTWNSSSFAENQQALGAARRTKSIEREVTLPPLRSQSADEEFAFINHFWRQAVMQRDKQFLVADDLSLPQLAIDGFKLLKLFPRKFESVPDDVGVLRNPADRRLGSLHTTPYSVDDPFEHPHVLRVA